ncbi:MAG TPA: AtpZ/AtpI family protein [Sphingomicrobium sp.]|nr:AtpZ/AtpI family protein [Sphingomicrobium sp.]
MMEDETGQEPKSPQDERLDSLEERLQRAQSREAERTGQARKPADANEQLGQRVLSTLIGGMLGGALVGWVLDRIFDTAPTLMIALIVLGTAGGFWSIVKMASRKP